MTHIHSWIEIKWTIFRFGCKNKLRTLENINIHYFFLIPASCEFQHFLKKNSAFCHKNVIVYFF